MAASPSEEAEAMRRWQRVGVATAMALAALLLRPRRAGGEATEDGPARASGSQA
jgi:hypothetical protein